MENQSQNSFPIPLVAGWAVNIVGWILFVSTSNHTLEIITGLLCIGCVYVGYKHKELNTEPAFGNERLSPANLIYASAFEAVWMLLWGFGIFGDF
jgi:heme/copper-type cytochrome/quinol oxidase subunit 3